MQIHELNNFNGNLDANTYLVADDGLDTGKVAITEITGPLNARLDNIITDPAPTGQEIIDARIGYDYEHFASLGDAIRGQVGSLHKDLNDFTQTVIGINLNVGEYEGGYFNTSGAETGTGSTSFRTSNYIPVESGSSVEWWGYLTDGTTLGASGVLVEYDAQMNVIGSRVAFNKFGSVQSTAVTLSNTTKYIRFGLYQAVGDYSTIKISIYYAADAVASYTPYTRAVYINSNDIIGPSGEALGEYIAKDLNLTPLYEYMPITVPKQQGAINPNNSSVIVTNDVTRYEIPVNAGEKYIVSARYGYATYKAYLLTDTNKKVLSYYPATTSGSAVLRDVEVDVKEDGYLILQNVYRYEASIGRLSKYIANDRLYRKSVYWNGDSICYGAGGNSYANQIAFFHAMETTMDAASGTRLSTRQGYTNSIYERVIAMDTSQDYDYISIEGGFNDYFSQVPIGALTADYTTAPDTTTLIGAVEAICQFIRTNFPESKFFFVLGHRPIHVGKYPTDVDTYWDAIITALEKWAVPYVDIRREGTLMAYNATWLSDYFGVGETMGTHPNTLGYALFYNDLVESKMQTL